MKQSIKNILSIAGSDPSGGAGVQADLKTIAALGGYGMAAITALTAQNTQGVSAVQIIETAFLAAQLEAIFSDIHVDAVKIGMLGDEHAARIVAETLQRFRPQVIVLDPVVVSTSGHRLTSQTAIDVMRQQLAPLASVVTPNIPEAEVFLKKAVLDVEGAAQELSTQFGGAPVVLKGGHATSEQACDVLCADGGVNKFETQRIQTKNTHGTGCTLSAALATVMAQGLPLAQALTQAKAYVTEAIRRSDCLRVGNGHGPLYHNFGQAQDG